MDTRVDPFARFWMPGGFSGGAGYSRLPDRSPSSLPALRRRLQVMRRVTRQTLAGLPLTFSRALRNSFRPLPAGRLKLGNTAGAKTCGQDRTCGSSGGIGVRGCPVFFSPLGEAFRRTFHAPGSKEVRAVLGTGFPGGGRKKRNAEISLPPCSWLAPVRSQRDPCMPALRTWPTSQRRGAGLASNPAQRRPLGQAFRGQRPVVGLPARRGR